MPLLIDLKTGDKIIVNGAALENAGAHAKLLVHNHAAILRSKEVLSEAEATTPASRIYFALQCAYVFPTKQAYYMNIFNTYLNDYAAACPSAADIIAEIKNEVVAEKLYKGLKAVQKLLAHEELLLKAFQQNTSAAPSPDSE